MGHKIKIAGDDPGIGVRFTSESDPSQSVKASGRLAENTTSKLIGIIPALSVGTWKAVIKTQYASGAAFLKTPRVVESAVNLTVDAGK
jgi:hypothetical protein